MPPSITISVILTAIMAALRLAPFSARLSSAPTARKFLPIDVQVILLFASDLITTGDIPFLVIQTRIRKYTDPSPTEGRIAQSPI